MFSLWMLSGWAFAIVVGGIGAAVYAIVKLLAFMLDLFISDPDMHRGKDKRDNQ